MWLVPLANLKDRKHRKEAFRVPLSSRAVEIAREMERIKVSDYVFPGQTLGKPFSNMALLVLLQRMNAAVTEKWVDTADSARLPRMAFALHSGPGRRRSPGFPMR